MGAGKVPLAKGDGPLDAAVSHRVPAAGGQAEWQLGGHCAGRIEHHADVRPGGMEIAERFNDWGATAFVLTYRLSPKYGDDARALDGNRADTTRSRPGEGMGTGSGKIGFAGFSAGSDDGATSWWPRPRSGDLDATDPLDRVNSRPDWLVMVYGPGRATPGENLKDFPPTFLLCGRMGSRRGEWIGAAVSGYESRRAPSPNCISIRRAGMDSAPPNGSPEFSPWMDTLRAFPRAGRISAQGPIVMLKLRSLCPEPPLAALRCRAVAHAARCRRVWTTAMATGLCSRGRIHDGRNSATANRANVRCIWSNWMPFTSANTR